MRHTFFGKWKAIKKEVLHSERLNYSCIPFVAPLTICIYIILKKICDVILEGNFSNWTFSVADGQSICMGIALIPKSLSGQDRI